MISLPALETAYRLTIFDAQRVLPEDYPLVNWWSADRHLCFASPYGPRSPYDEALSLAIWEMQICVECRFPWHHALTEPFRCAIEGDEFVGAQGGLRWTEERGWE